MSEDLLSRIPRGIKLHLGSAPTSVVGTERVTGIEVGGITIDTSIVLFMTGVRPNSTLAKQLGLKIGALGGITINNLTETSKGGVYAVGDCVEMTDSLTSWNQMGNKWNKNPHNKRAPRKLHHRSLPDR